MAEQGEISQKVTGAEYAATSATGNATITITNYYYGEAARRAPVTSADADAEILPCPYRGLFHFGPEDAAYFFGRESVVETLVQATQTRNFIPLLGASGSGKSSVVLAGLVPQLQQAGQWQFTHFRPGADPFKALSLALIPLYTPHLDATDRIAQVSKLATYLRQGDVSLADVFAQIQQNFPHDRVLLIADQFEELYTLCREEATRRTFLDRLMAAFPKRDPANSIGLHAQSPRLVLTMRADFLGNALSYRPFADVLQNADLKLGPMNREELTAVIVKPAEKLGVAFEAGLVERILKDVEAEPGKLPLLEFALTELWQRRQGKQLTHVAYTDIGEVQGALARHADASYGQLSPAEQHQMRRIFIQLVRPGEGAEDTRRLATKVDVGGEANWALVKKLADDRLVITSRNDAAVETVEVVHEALIRSWGKLKGWMVTDRVFRAWQERLRGGMAQWQIQKDEGSLLRGAALAEAEEKLKERRDDLSEAEQDFIVQSLRQAATQRRRKTITTWGIVAGSLVAVGVSSGFAWMAQSKTKEAELNQKKAELNQANSLGRYAQSLFNEGQELDAVVQAIRAGKTLQKHRATAPEVMRALQTAIYEVSERNRLNGHAASVGSVSFSPDGQTLAIGSADKTIKLWNLKTGKEVRTLKGHDASVGSVSFSPDGQTLASGSADNTIKLWNLETGKEVRTLRGHDFSVLSVSFSRDGQTLASGSIIDNTIKLWNLKTGKELRTLRGHTDPVRSVISPDGQTLASGSDKTIKLWNLETGKELRTLKGHDSYVWSVRFSPDGQTLASGSDDQTIKLWNLKTGKELRTLKGTAAVWSVISPDGQTLTSGSADKTIKLWNRSTDQAVRTLKGTADIVRSVSFSPDGQTLASDGSDDQTIKLWNLETGKELRTLKGHDSWVWSVSFSPDGQTLASSANTTIKLWNLKTGKAVRTLKGHDALVSSVSFSRDGQTLASGSNDQTIKLWNLKTGKELRTLKGHDAAVGSVSFSRDGKTLASGSADKTIKLWNLETGKELRTLKGHDAAVGSVSFSPDGKTLASGSNDQTIKLWNLETGKELRTLKGHAEAVGSVSFSPDGKTLASGSADKTIKLWAIDLNLDSLIGRGCDGIRNYLTYSSEVSESDRHLCDGIGNGK